MATKLMGDAGLLDQPLGQLICCAAMIDDVASLVLLAMISSASGTDTSTSAESDAGNNDDSENSSGDSSSSSSKQDDDVVLWGPTEGVWAVCIPLLASLLFLGASLLLAQHMPSMMRALSRATAAPPPPLASTHLTAPSNSLAASASNLTETATPPATSSTNTIAVSRTTNAAPRALNPDDEVGQSDEAPTTALWHKPRSEPSNELSNEASNEPPLADRVLLALVFGCAAALTAGAQVCRTTPLLGCFMAGVSARLLTSSCVGRPSAHVPAW